MGIVTRAAEAIAPPFEGAAASDLPRAKRSLLATVSLTVLVFLASCVGVVAIAVLNQPYFDFLNSWLRTTETVPRGLLYSSFLVLVALPFVARDPARYGLRLGNTLAQWRLVAALCIAAAIVTAVILKATGSIPYSDASLFIEAVDVPVTEELLFRAVLLTVLLGVLGRLWAAPTAVRLAIAFDGVAFGLGHAANALSYPVAFVASQVTFACLLGIACAFLMVRTRSVLPAVVLHGVVNAVVVLI